MMLAQHPGSAAAGCPHPAQARARRRLAEFLREERGAALVEFAFAGPIVIMSLMAVIEVALVIFLNMMVESGVREAARFGLTGGEETGYTREEYIVEIVNQRTMGLLEITEDNISVKVYDSFEDIQDAEPYTDANINGQHDAGESYTDSNGNGAYDGDPGIPGAGGSGDIVLYQITAEWSIFTALLADVLGDNGLFTITASMVVRNEPWEVEVGS
jgi:Flp pilus assembly pilin Flp